MRYVGTCSQMKRAKEVMKIMDAARVQCAMRVSKSGSRPGEAEMVVKPLCPASIEIDPRSTPSMDIEMQLVCI